MSEQNLMQNKLEAPASDRLKPILLVGLGLVIAIVFTIWSGVLPSGDRALPFWIGTAVLLVFLSIWGSVTWHLLFRPLPAGHSVRAQPMNASYRQAIALLLGVGGFGIVVGAFWDEVWHRQYGIPFGEDFFWRPHMLMYVGFGVATLLAFTGLYIINRRGQGTLQQRFRANPAIGLLILVGGFLMFVLPADPIWHQIYGVDLTAWGIPHLLLVTSFVLVLLLATAIHMTVQPKREWGTPLQLRLSDLLPLLMFATTSLMWGQFFTTEWDTVSRFTQARPEWLLPVLIASGGAFIGVMANHTLRTFGAATLTGLLALGMRLALIRLFNVEAMMHLNAWVLMLPSMLLIDVWYAYRRDSWVGAGVAAAVGMALALLTIFKDFYPHVPITNLPVALGAILVGSLGLSWLGVKLGDYFAQGNPQEEAVQSRRLPLATLAVVAATALFIIFFVTTATPPA
jgi:hypothetical protein